jgi:hypothetical protein
LNLYLRSIEITRATTYFPLLCVVCIPVWMPSSAIGGELDREGEWFWGEIETVVPTLAALVDTHAMTGSNLSNVV